MKLKVKVEHVIADKKGTAKVIVVALPLLNYRVLELKMEIAAAVFFACCTNEAVYFEKEEFYVKIWI